MLKLKTQLDIVLYPSILSSFPVIRTASAKNRRFHVPQPTFLFPLETPLRVSRNMLHGWKGNSMLVKLLAACTYPGASTPYKRWSKCTMEKVGGNVFAET